MNSPQELVTLYETVTILRMLVETDGELQRCLARDTVGHDHAHHLARQTTVISSPSLASAKGKGLAL